MLRGKGTRLADAFILTHTSPPHTFRSAQQPQALRNGHQVDPRSTLTQLPRRRRRGHLPEIRPSPVSVLSRSCATIPRTGTSCIRAPLMGTGELLLPLFLLYRSSGLYSPFCITSTASSANSTASPAYGPLSWAAPLPRPLTAASSSLS